MQLLLGLLAIWLVSASPEENKFDSNSDLLKGYSENLAKELLDLAAVSYCAGDTILNWSCRPCASLATYELFNLVIGLTPDGIETKVVFMVSKTKKRVVISFEGTHDPKQLLNEILQFTGVSYTIHNIPDAVAMKYFYNTYTNTLRDSVLENLASLKKGFGDYQLIFTGHSLGGALAEHAALDSMLSGLAEIQEPDGFDFAGSPLLYTYGEPRIGNYYISQEVNKHYKGRYYRVTHGHDIVPHVPPCGPTLTSGCYKPESTVNILYGGYHAGYEIFYPGSGSTYTECDEGESEKCSNQNLFNLSVNDHLEYLDMNPTCS